MLPLVGLIFFMRRLPEAHARAHRAVGEADSSRTSRTDRTTASLTVAATGDEPRRMTRRMFAQVAHLRSAPSVDWFAHAAARAARRGRSCSCSSARSSRAVARSGCYAAFTVPSRWRRSWSRSSSGTDMQRRTGRRRSSAARSVRRLSAVHHRRDLRRGRARRRCSPTTTSAARTSTAPRSTPSCCSSAVGGVVMASANDLIVLFLGLEMLSIALYILAGSHARRIQSQEAGDQVLRARRLLFGVLPLRRRAHLRRHGHHEHGPDPRLPATNVAGRQRPAVRRLGAHARRLRLQGGGRAVPHRGHPTSTRASRRPSPAFMASAVKAAGFAGLLRVFVVAFATYRERLAPGRLRARRADADRRRGLGRRADEREAHAGLLVDQPRRVHPRGVQAAIARGHRGRALLSPRRTRSSSSAHSPSSRSWPVEATAATHSTTSVASDAGARCWRWRSRSSCCHRPGCRSRAGSSPSSR